MEELERIVAYVPSEFKHQIQIICATERLTLTQFIIDRITKAEPELLKYLPRTDEAVANEKA